ncbi:hypothetical protein ACLOJK_022907, partial [Asimina triloba]
PHGDVESRVLNTLDVWHHQTDWGIRRRWRLSVLPGRMAGQMIEPNLMLALMLEISDNF